MSDGVCTIVDLRDYPRFFDLVADRIWHAWWQPSGRKLRDVETALNEVFSAHAYPFTLVAQRDGNFLGTVTSIFSDIEARPDIGPCLAALWVEPEARGQGIATALADALMGRLVMEGFEEVYLSAKPKMRNYYQPRGWTLIECDIDDDHHEVYRRDLKGGP